MENKTFIILIACIIICLALGTLFGRYIIPNRPTSVSETNSVRSFMPSFTAEANVQGIPKPIVINRIIKTYDSKNYDEILQAKIELQSIIDSLLNVNPFINDMRYSTQHDSSFFSPDNPSLKIDSHVDVDFYLRTRMFDLRNNIKATISDRDTVQVPVQSGMSFFTSASIGAMALTVIEAILYAIFKK
jgi:hypothetical protein